MDTDEIRAHLSSLEAKETPHGTQTTDAEMCLRRILQRLKAGKPLDDMLPAIERFAFQNATALRNSTESQESARERKGWINVKDRLPEAPGAVLMYCAGTATEAPAIVAGWLTADGRSQWLASDASQVTHWMPLPTYPDNERKERE